MGKAPMGWGADVSSSNPSIPTGGAPVPPSTATSILKCQGAYLPHWTREGASYAVNFRLGDSLPKHVLEGWRRERAALERALEMRGELSEGEQKRLADLYIDLCPRLGSLAQDLSR